MEAAAAGAHQIDPQADAEQNNLLQITQFHASPSPLSQSPSHHLGRREHQRTYQEKNTHVKPNLCPRVSR
jgi:hypothetical protein